MSWFVLKGKYHQAKNKECSFRSIPEKTLFAAIIILLIMIILMNCVSSRDDTSIDANPGNTALKDAFATSYPGLDESPSVVEVIVDLNAQNSLEDSCKVLPDNSGNSSVHGSTGSFSATSKATLGSWKAFVNYTPTAWEPGSTVRAIITLSFQKKIAAELKKRHPGMDKVCILITAERDFGPDGFQHVPWNYGVSTLLTATGLPIEGGGFTPRSRFTGSGQRTPVDIMLEAPLQAFEDEENTSGWCNGRISCAFDLPGDLPPGIYRLRLDIGMGSEQSTQTNSGITVQHDYYNLNGDGIGTLPRNQNVSCFYSPPIATSGLDAGGNMIIGTQIKRRCYMELLWGYNSNGYQGVVAREDQTKVAVSPRDAIQDEVILPRFSPEGRAYQYSLEPHILMDDVDPQRNIPWRYDRGEWSVRMTLPDGASVSLWSPEVKVPISNGTVLDLGTFKFVGESWIGPTTNDSILTAWVPPAYGRYSIEAKGWIEDIWGNRYYGGGNYTFWIANRLTVATATFLGQPYTVGDRYGRDLTLSPPVPADVTITADLYGNSDPNDIRRVVSTGQATPGGVFGAAQGMKYLDLDAPGEYLAKIVATYTDHQGNLWVGAARHAGVVYPGDTKIVAHGKKMLVGSEFVERGESHFEGFKAENNTYYIDHLTFPYNSGDVLLIASDQQGANKIEPVLTYERWGENTYNGPDLRSVGRSNLKIETSNGLAPEMFPEYITNISYFYASAPRPGFVSRFIVGQGDIFEPYWPTSPNSFGGQYGASNNGDLPGDIYRLLGGVVMIDEGEGPKYAGYQSSAFILPGGSNNNRIIGPGEEDLPGPDGIEARFFLVPVRPGSVYQQGTNFTAFLQIDPVLPCEVQFYLTAPDGSTRVAEGQGDRLGYFVSKEKWLLDQAGVWTYKVNATWNGYKGRVPGLSENGGYIFVIERDNHDEWNRTGPGITLNLSGEEIFSPAEGLEIQGNSSASQIYFTAITPGAVLEEGMIPVKDGRFTYHFDPARMAERIKTYDITNLLTGKPEIGRIVHLTFFSEEKGASGPYHSFARVILRGNKAIYVKD